MSDVDRSPAGDRPHVVIVGQMGAGKTTVGVLVAEALERPFIDNDVVLQERSGRTAAEIEAAEGIDHLHDLERGIFEDLLGGEEPAVVAAAASVIVGVDRQTLADRAFVAWIHVSPEVLAERAATSAHRPLPPDHRQQLFERLVAERDQLFAVAADVVVDGDHVDPHDEAAQVLRALGLAR